MRVNRTPTHPGEMLREEFLAPLGITQSGLAQILGVSFRTINELVNCRRELSVEMALKLARFFGTTPELWLNLQNQFDIHVLAERKGRQINGIKPLVQLAPTR